MKSIKGSSYMLILLMASFIIGCEKDKPGKSNLELLVGKWEIETVKWVHFDNKIKIDEGTDTYEPGNIQWEFLKDGIGKSYNNGELIITFAWTLNGNSLTFDEDGKITEMVLTVDESKLILKQVGTYEDNGNTYDFVSTVTAKRI